MLQGNEIGCLIDDNTQTKENIHMTVTANKSQPIPQWWLWLTLPIGLLLATATLAGILIGDLYQGNTPLMAAQLVGGDYAALIGILPVLIGSALLAWRGSQRALLIWVWLF
jgi:hypothetical protein